RSYAHAEPTARRCSVPGSGPRAHDRTAHAPSATRAARRSPAGETSPRTTGLSARPVATSRAASTASLHHPTDSCPVSTAAATSAVVAGGAPAPAASPVARTVTTAVGAAWAARAYATTPRTARGTARAMARLLAGASDRTPAPSRGGRSVPRCG